jgi:serine/threonine protein kinase
MNPSGSTDNPAMQAESAGGSAPQPPNRAPQPPEIPDHELLHRIGSGAYGEVWLARNAIGTLRAVKIVHRQSFQHADHFEREFKGLLKFEPISRSHDGLVDVLQIGRRDDAGYFYYVMELADDSNAECGTRNAELATGTPASTPHSALRTPHSYTPRTLRSDLQTRGRLPPTECVTIGLKLAAALEHLHANGLVHRDIKPSNIIFVNDEPKLADIGLVTAIDEAHSLVGTVGYIPPEGPGTPQADLYSLGKVLYEIALGKDRQDFPQLPPDLPSHPDYAALLELNEVILKACETDPRWRYPSAEAMLAELELLQRGQSVQRKRTLQQRWAAARKAMIALAGVGLLAASVGMLRRWTSPSDLHPDGPASTNTDANMLCDQGLMRIRGDNIAEFAEAYTNFHRAIERDPHFARPYIGLLELRLRESVPSLKAMPPEEMRIIAGQLQQLAPNLAATHCAQSIINWFDWNYPQARRCALRAIKADPKYELGHTWYGFIQCMWGYTNESRAELRISQKIRPSKVTIYRCLGQTYYLQRDYTNTILWERKALEQLESHHVIAFYTIGQAYMAMGDYSNALVNFEKADINSGADASETGKRYGRLRQAFADGGAQGYWREQWRQTEENPDGDFYWKAVIQVHLGNTPEAFRWLNKSCDTHERHAWDLDGPLSYLLYDEDWDYLHNDPRFRAILDRIGFTKVMPRRKR